LESKKTDKYTYFRVSRKLDTGDKSSDVVIVKGEKHQFIWSLADTDGITQHIGKDKGSFEAILSTQVGKQGAQIDDRSERIRFLHIWTLIIVWSIISDVSLIFGRFLKTIKYYNLIHSITYSIILILSWVFGIWLLLISKPNYNFNFTQ
jgi:hypothetical protein